MLHRIREAEQRLQLDRPHPFATGETQGHAGAIGAVQGYRSMIEEEKSAARLKSGWPG